MYGSRLAKRRNELRKKLDRVVSQEEVVQEMTARRGPGKRPTLTFQTYSSWEKYGCDRSFFLEAMEAMQAIEDRESAQVTA